MVPELSKGVWSCRFNVKDMVYSEGHPHYRISKQNSSKPYQYQVDQNSNWVDSKVLYHHHELLICELATVVSGTRASTAKTTPWPPPAPRPRRRNKQPHTTKARRSARFSSSTRQSTDESLLGTEILVWNETSKEFEPGMFHIRFGLKVRVTDVSFESPTLVHG